MNSGPLCELRLPTQCASWSAVRAVQKQAAFKDREIPDA